MSFEDGKPWKVNAKVTPEMIEDLNAQSGIDVVALLEQTLVDEITLTGVSDWVDRLIKETRLSPEHQSTSILKEMAVVYWGWDERSRDTATKIFEREHGPHITAEAIFIMTNLFHEVRGSVVGKQTGIL